MKKNKSTLTLRLDPEGAKRLNIVKTLTRESTSSGAIDKAIRSYPLHLKEIADNEKYIEQLESKLRKSEEVFSSLRENLKYITSSKG